MCGQSVATRDYLHHTTLPRPSGHHYHNSTLVTLQQSCRGAFRGRETCNGIQEHHCDSQKRGESKRILATPPTSTATHMDPTRKYDNSECRFLRTQTRPFQTIPKSTIAGGCSLTGRVTRCWGHKEVNPVRERAHVRPVSLFQSQAEGQFASGRLEDSTSGIPIRPFLKSHLLTQTSPPTTTEHVQKNTRQT